MFDRGQFAVSRPQYTVLCEVCKKVWNPTIRASLGNAPEGTESMRHQRNDVGRHRVTYAVGCCEVATPGLEPIGR